jgi:hypothetical protein
MNKILIMKIKLKKFFKINNKISKFIKLNKIKKSIIILMIFLMTIT